MFMGTKTITIMEDAYEILLRKKHSGESFSEVIRRMTGVKRDIMDFAGAWKNISEKDAENLKESILKLRKKSTSELLKKLR